MANMGLVIVVSSTLTMVLVAALLVWLLCRCNSSRNVASKVVKRRWWSRCHQQSTKVVGATHFRWDDHPSLIASVVENGWASFAFSYPSTTTITPIITSDLADLAHTIELNPNATLEPHVEAVRAMLPLPGPFLGPLSFPQDAYFEITIITIASQNSFTNNDLLPIVPKHGVWFGGSQMTQTLEEATLPIIVIESPPLPDTTIHSCLVPKPCTTVPPNKLSTMEDPHQVLVVGLALASASSSEFPGSYLGSIGYHSSGHIYVNGTLHEESGMLMDLAKHGWGDFATTVGCGFNPMTKRVYFTLNGECISEVTLTSNDFENPLYPVIASNYNASVSINYGQSSFEYAPANPNRLPNPCFKRPSSRLTNAEPHMHEDEDSGDLFSIGELDLAYTESPSSQESYLDHHIIHTQENSEFIEIVLVRKGQGI